MNEKQITIYKEIKSKFEKLMAEKGVDSDQIKITSRGLTPEEAIGVTTRKDYPILTGKEIMLQADYKGAIGQAFTDAPADFDGSLKDVLSIDLINDQNGRGIFFGAINGVMRYFEQIDHTVHCKNQEPAECATEYLKFVHENFPETKIALIGYQPSLFEALSGNCKLRVLDLNPDNVGQMRFGIQVEHGIEDYEKVVIHWADLVLCTGSVFCNGTMDKYVDIGKPVVFFGTSAAGAVQLLGLQRFCPLSK
ncbi:MAG: DUF364 domain-containing protein [Anaerovorax sp.]